MDSMLSGNQYKLPRKAENICDNTKNMSHEHRFTQLTVFSITTVCVYLNNKCMCIGDLVLRGHVLLHSLSRSPDGQQYECVGQEYDSAGHDVAKKEEADDVAHSCRVLAWCMPVDAACCTVRLFTILSPA